MFETDFYTTQYNNCARARWIYCPTYDKISDAVISEAEALPYILLRSKSEHRIDGEFVDAPHF
jgi:hypothetical protein